MVYWLLAFFLAVCCYETNGKLEVWGNGLVPKKRLRLTLLTIWLNNYGQKQLFEKDTSEFLTTL